MDVTTLVALHDQNARNEVEHRLYFTQRQKPDGSGANMVESTRTVVYATDPLKEISYPFECLMTVPTDPPSNKVQIIGGYFFANGKLYPFPGMETPEIVIDLNQDTYVLTGVRIDPDTDRTDLYVQTTHGEYPFMDRSVVPSALIKIPAGFNTIISGYITDLRPFLHYNVSTPEDRAVVDISCINPNESVTFELMRNKRLPPIMNFYKKVPPEGTHTIVHRFESMDDIVVLGEDEPDVSSSMGVTLKQTIIAQPITMPSADNVLFVSALTGHDSGDGTAEYPLLTLGAAIDRFNGMTQYDTIFVLEGIYNLNSAKQINRDLLLIGESPTKVSIRLTNNTVTVLNTVNPSVDVTFRTVTFISNSPVLAATVTSNMQFAGAAFFYNCIFKQAIGSTVLPMIFCSGQLTIANCVLHNPYYTVSTTSSSYLFSTVGGTKIVINCYIIGPWRNTFVTGVTTRNYEDTGDGSSFAFDSLTTYYPTAGTTMGVHSGMFIGTNTTDLDDAPISVGIYGGQWAAMFKKKWYPINQMPVFKYRYHTLYSPVIARFVSITLIAGFNPPGGNCQIYGAVSFNGGHDWVVWDELLGSWKRIADLETLDINGNRADELCMRLVNNGPITTKGEICFAWALKSGNPYYTPNIKGVQMTVKANADTLTPIYPQDLDVWIAEDTVMVTNLSGEKQNDVVIVAY